MGHAKKLIFFILLITATVGLIFWWLYDVGKKKEMASITTFEECAAAGFPIMESYPRRCSVFGGATFTENVASPGKENLIRVIEPKTDAVISTPASVRGEARGTWFFEASFPVKIIDETGKILGIGVAQAEGEWMTESFVPFSASVKFDRQDAARGFVVLEKDNPSGLPEHAAEIRIPVSFAGSGEIQAACRPTGCSRHICADKDIVSTCEYRPEYACYKNARCERQSSGQCGWTKTSILEACISKSLEVSI